DTADSRIKRVTDQDALMQGASGSTLAQETLALMQRHGVAPTGANYEVWLTYRLGVNPTLRESIDERIGSREAFTAEFSTELYERSSTGVRASAQLLLAGERIARDIGQVISFLKSAEEKSGDYGRKLETAATDLGRGLAPEQIRQIVSSLAAATLDMAN